jgi:hypothetical protein
MLERLKRSVPALLVLMVVAPQCLAQEPTRGFGGRPIVLNADDVRCTTTTFRTSGTSMTMGMTRRTGRTIFICSRSAPFGEGGW